MGRYYFDAKKTVEDSTELSIFRLNGWGLLKGRHSTNLTWTRKFSGSESSASLVIDVTCEKPYARIVYTITRYRDGSKQDYDYRIGLVKTPCHLGGVRYWFCCPQCGRRVAKLYRKPMGEMYLCRICNNLSYESRNESRLGRWGQIGHFLVAERQMRELEEKIKRRHYAGKPTRRYRRVLKLQHRLNSIHIPQIEELLFSGKRAGC
jgi:hypothetical protein